MTPKVLTWPEMAPLLRGTPIAPLMKSAFVAYSNGDAVIPPVGELVFDNPPGDVHIKYGYVRNGPHYVVKMASGFYENPKLGLASSQGLMVLFCIRTGRCLAVLLDDGRLTDLRTAAAGVLTIDTLAAPEATHFGFVGTGTQARAHLSELCTHQRVFQYCAWGRTKKSLDAFIAFARTLDIVIEPYHSLQALVTDCQVLLTTTPSQTPLIQNEWVQPGTHITAIGSDTPEKQELDTRLLSRADRIVVDSRAQSRTRGEVYRAIRATHLNEDKIEELGTLLTTQRIARHPTDITVADLTGLAVQDLAIATYVYSQCAGDSF